MITFKEALDEIDLYRIDHGKTPKFFRPTSRDYIGRDIGGATQSQGWDAKKGLPPGGWSRSKGTYAAEKRLAVPYSIPRHIPWVHHRENGKDIITVHKDDLDTVKKSEPTVSKFSSKPFSKVNDNEWMSRNDGGMITPKKQKKVKTHKFLHDNGFELRTTDDIEKHIENVGNKLIGAET